LGAYYSPSYA
jgi:hypothetical protein